MLRNFKLTPFPKDFHEKGKYRTWDKGWNPTGFADQPHYRGQPPVTYPLNATLFEILVGGYVTIEESADA